MKVKIEFDVLKEACKHDSIWTPNGCAHPVTRGEDARSIKCDPETCPLLGKGEEGEDEKISS